MTSAESIVKWPDKSTTSYDMLDFKGYIENLLLKYRLIKQYIAKVSFVFAIYDVLLADIYLQNFSFNF